MVFRMPVLGSDTNGEFGEIEQVVYNGSDGTASFHCKRSILDIFSISENWHNVYEGRVYLPAGRSPLACPPQSMRGRRLIHPVRP